MNAPEVASVTRKLQQSMLNAYADASGDHNPIHVDEAFAKTTQMGGTIAHGMLVLSFISEMMTAAFGRLWLESGSLDVRFRNPARPGDSVTARAAPQAPKDGRLRYAVECVNDAGEQLITGTAEVIA
ncbi:MAG TPA: MaoC/PaaZ C-terminal domain-containing protein [Dehalococcoidia bacterium]|nr:MaoC/PaaZ C-terminal domain-containing protein [Dehalococcoidia bacterium]